MPSVVNVHGSLTTWSKIRVEEKWAEVRSITTEMLNICVSQCLISSEYLLETVHPLANDLCAAFENASFKNKSDDKKFHSKVKGLATACESAIAQMIPCMDVVAQARCQMPLFAAGAKKLGKCDASLVNALGSDIQSAMLLCRDANIILGVALKGFLPLCSLLNGGGSEQPLHKALSAFDEGFPIVDGGLDLSRMRLHIASDTMLSALTLTECSRTLAGNSDMFDRMGDLVGPHMKPDLLALLNLLVGNALVQKTRDHITTPLAQATIKHFVDKVGLKDIMSVGEGDLAEYDILKALPLVIGGDINRLAATAMSAVSFSPIMLPSEAVLANLSKEEASTSTVIHKLIGDGSMWSDSLQHSHGEQKPLTCKTIAYLLVVYTKVFPVMTFSAVVHTIVLSTSGLNRTPEQAALSTRTSSSSTAPPPPPSLQGSRHAQSRPSPPSASRWTTCATSWARTTCASTTA